MITEILKKLNLKYEDLSSVERETLKSWENALREPSVSVKDLSDFIATQIELAEVQISDYSNDPKKDLYLKAVLRNLRMIQAFIQGPEQRKKWIETHIKQLTKG